jgi:chromosome segregation ATPase
VNDLKADYARQLSAAEARVADIEAARAAAEQQAQALQQQLESSKAVAEQVWLVMGVLAVTADAAACIKSGLHQPCWVEHEHEREAVHALSSCVFGSVSRTGMTPRCPAALHV